MTHLSDEAVAAFADDVLRGNARERAKKHCAECAECNYAVATQREAIWALRAAPAPSLPIGLLDRLRDVPASTPIRSVPTTTDDDGTMMFATFGAAALVPPSAEPKRTRHLRPFMTTSAAVVAVAAALTAGSVAAVDTNDSPRGGHGSTITTELRPAQLAAHVERTAADR